jgi:hypothetical protein
MAENDWIGPEEGGEGEDGESPGTPEPVGPMSRDRFARTVIERVRRRFPLVKIGRAPNSFSVRVNGQVASLENLYRISRLKPGDLQHQVERWAVEILRAGEGTPDRRAELDDVRDRILPMLVRSSGEFSDDDALFDPSDAMAALDAVHAGKSAGAKKAEASLVTRPLVPGLRVAFVIDGDRTIAYVPWESLRRWGLTLSEIEEIAMSNLVERSDEMHAHAAQDEMGDVSLILFQSLDGFDSSRLLLPNLHDRLRDHIGSPFVAAVPNRDTLLCFREDHETFDAIRSQIRHDFQTMPHQISDGLLLVTPDGLSKYEPDEPLG